MTSNFPTEVIDTIISIFDEEDEVSQACFAVTCKIAYKSYRKSKEYYENGRLKHDKASLEEVVDHFNGFREEERIQRLNDLYADTYAHAYLDNYDSGDKYTGYGDLRVIRESEDDDSTDEDEGEDKSGSVEEDEDESDAMDEDGDSGDDETAEGAEASGDANTDSISGAESEQDEDSDLIDKLSWLPLQAISGHRARTANLYSRNFTSLSRQFDMLHYPKSLSLQAFFDAVCIVLCVRLQTNPESSPITIIEEKVPWLPDAALLALFVVRFQQFTLYGTLAMLHSQEGAHSFSRRKGK
ncbi:hypothetical protein BDZ45DRAFT_721782 [Acephala macrosclerotiorum]|nr:hypothetical protein BDZ45DRAFT_721782 [Acephala macrosclerotiorum]